MNTDHLGPLERDILKIVWQKQRASVNDVLGELTQQDQHLAYTTVMTIMTRLVDKKVLRRTKEGRCFVYQPATAKDNFLRQIVHNTLSSLVNRFGEEAIVAFMEEAQTLSSQDRSKLLKKLKK